MKLRKMWALIAWRPLKQTFRCHNSHKTVQPHISAQTNTQRETHISPWNWGHIGIKKRTNHVIYHWKAYLSGSQKNHVNTILSIIFQIYGPPSQRLQISQYQFFWKKMQRKRDRLLGLKVPQPFILSIYLI